MIYQPFQHTEPKHVYRAKHWRVALVFVTVLLFALIFILWQYRQEMGGVSLVWILTLSVLCISVPLNQAFRHKLVISPAGISITDGNTTTTAWSNVMSLQLVPQGSFGPKKLIPCLILHNVLPNIPPSRERGMPAELRGRALPIQFHLWERPNEIEQDFQKYLPQPADAGLFVPHSFAARPQSSTRSALFILGVLVVVGFLTFFVFIL